jgi:hypothetical protein
MTTLHQQLLIPASTYHHQDTATALLPLMSSGAQEHPPQTVSVVGQQDRIQRAFFRAFLIFSLVVEVCALYCSSSAADPAAASQHTSHVRVILLVVVSIAYCLSLERRLRNGQELQQQLALCHWVLLFTTGLAMGSAVVWIARVGFDSRIPPVLYIVILVGDCCLFDVREHHHLKKSSASPSTSSRASLSNDDEESAYHHCSTINCGRDDSFLT